MLRITRADKDDYDTIIIGDNIKVKVLSIKGHQVRFGIDAPKEVNIVRDELVMSHEDLKERRSRFLRKGKIKMTRT